MNGQRRAEFVLLCAAGAALLLTILSVLTRTGTDANYVFVYGVQGSVYFFAAAFLAMRSRSTSGNWAFIAGAFLVMTASSVCYQLRATVEIAGKPTDVGDSIWLIAYPLAIIGVARLARHGVPASAPEWLDILLVSASGFSVAAMTIGHAVSGQLHGDITPDIVVNYTSVLCDMVLLSVVLGAVQRAKWHPDPSMWVLSVAGLLYAIFDSQYAVQVITGTYAWGAMFDVAWPLSAFLFVIAAWIQRSEPATARDRTSTTYLLVPALFTLIAGGVLLVPSVNVTAMLGKVFAAFAIVLAVVRMYLSVEAATRLASQLRAAQVDTETGLHNRRWLLDAGPVLAPGSVVIEFAIDGLAEVSADFGTRVGQAAILEVAERIRAGLRSDDVVFRTGDERLAVLLRESTPALAATLAEATIRSIERPMSIDGFLISLAASAGVSSRGDARSLPGELLAEASAACVDAMRSADGLAHTFSERTAEHSQDRLRMRAQIREILRSDADDFVPYFQPIDHVAHHELLCVEALVRWHRDGRVLMPSEFLGEVDDIASMRALTRHTMFVGLTALRAHGISHAMSVNVRPDVMDEQLPEIVQDALRATGSRASQLIVEVTEKIALQDAATVARVITQLRASGIRVLLDDFGTGGATLSNLRDFPVDGLKFGAPLIERMWSDHATKVIVRGATELARELGMFVVYEGVETDTELAKYADLDSGYVQGFALGRPMQAQDLQIWLQSRAHRVSE